MNAAEHRAKLAQTKMALADKYMRLARVVKSKVRRASWLRQVDKYRRQAAQLLGKDVKSV
jgi:hypothetical protein